MKLKVLKIGLTKNGADLKIGEVFETDDVSGASLVAGEWAAEEPDLVEAPKSNENGEGDKIPAEGQTQGEMEPGQSNSRENKETDSEDQNADLEKIRKALDDQYKRDELYEAAKAAGVDIAYDAKKAEIVEAAIVQGKATALLK